MSVCLYFIEFMFFSFLGWVYECVFCMVKEHHWENRGFLFGPICPIYGVGMIVTIIFFGNRPLTRLFLYATKGIPFSADPPDVPYWATFILCAVSATVLEYVTSVTLEKRFHARWWDYSDMPLNFNGRICIPAAVGFGLLGIATQRFILPLSSRIHAALPDQAGGLLSLVLMALLTADIVLTVESLKHITEKLIRIEDRLNKQLQAAYESVEGAPASVKAAMRTKIIDRVKEHLPEATKEELMTLKRVNRLSIRGAGSMAVKNVIRLFTVSFVFVKKGGRVIVQKSKKAGKKLTAPFRFEDPETVQEQGEMQETHAEIGNGEDAVQGVSQTNAKEL